MNTVKSIFSSILTDFVQSQSDRVSIEATQFEQLEKDFSEYLKDDLGEEFIIDLMERICVESLHKDLYSYWLIIKRELSINRISLVENDQWETEAREAKHELAEKTLRLLRVLMEDSGTTPDLNDALNCCHLDT